MSILLSVEEYTRHWTKSEGEEFETLFKWIKSIRKLFFKKTRIHHLRGKMYTSGKWIT
jgi:hypothetical protein